MKAKILLRISSALMLLHALGHSAGALTWNKAPNAAIGQVIDGMVSNHFNFMGTSVTLSHFYAGYGYCMIAVLLFLTILLWLLSNESQVKVVLSLGLFLLTLGVLEFIFFFPLPAILSALASLLTLAAYFQTRRV